MCGYWQGMAYTDAMTRLRTLLTATLLTLPACHATEVRVTFTLPVVRLGDYGYGAPLPAEVTACTLDGYLHGVLSEIVYSDTTDSWLCETD